VLALARQHRRTQQYQTANGKISYICICMYVCLYVYYIYTYIYTYICMYTNLRAATRKLQLIRNAFVYIVVGGAAAQRIPMSHVPCALSVSVALSSMYV
jgi:hypothetical protein